MGGNGNGNGNGRARRIEQHPYRENALENGHPRSTAILHAVNIYMGALISLPLHLSRLIPTK